MYPGHVLAWYTKRQWRSRHADHDHGNLAIFRFLRLEWAQQYCRLCAPSSTFHDTPLLTLEQLPESGGISTAGMIAYFVFWIIQLPLLLIPPTRLRYLFIVKMIAAPITAIATLGYMVHKAGGSGAIFSQPGTVTGDARAYLWLSCMSSVTGVWATLAVNVADFSRYAKARPDGKPNHAQYVQLPALPILFTLCGVLGVITTSASKVVYGEFYWNPLDIVEQWLKNGHAGRAAAFFAALSWFIAQVGTNITGNSISAANDLCVMAPKYINIRRGCIIAAVVSCWVMVPWKILKNAQTFLSFMSGYSVFLAPMAGKCCDSSSVEEHLLTLSQAS